MDSTPLNSDGNTTASEVLRICADQLEEIGASRLASQLRALSAGDEPILIKSSYRDSGLQGYEPVGRLQGRIFSTSGRQYAEDVALAQLIAEAKKKGVRYVCGLGVVRADPVGEPGNDLWDLVIAGDGYA